MPVFTPGDMATLRRRAEAAKVKHIPYQATGITEKAYDIRAYNFAHAYKRGAEPWMLMNKKQRLWLWKIKDSLK